MASEVSLLLRYNSKGHVAHLPQSANTSIQSPIKKKKNGYSVTNMCMPFKCFTNAAARKKHLKIAQWTMVMDSWILLAVRVEASQHKFL